MSRKILVVDDEPGFAASLAPALKFEDFDVVASMSPEDAVETFKNENPELVLLDVNLSGRPAGIDLVKTLRSLNQKTPVIMVSGMARTGDVVRSIKFGADDFIEKSQVADSLLDKISNVIAERHNKASNEEPTEDSPSVSTIEYNALVSALEECGGNISKVAKLLSLSRDTVYRRLKKFNIGIKKDFTS